MMVAKAVLMSSCSKEMITGSGTTGTRALSVPAFSSVESHYDISATISYGAAQDISVSVYDNLLDQLDIKVEQGVLKLKYNTQYNHIRNSNVKATIRIPSISRAIIHGSGNIQVSDFADGDAFNAVIHGSGNINVSNSRYQSAVIDIHGSGNVHARGLSAKQAQANIYGSGDTRISVQEKLTARIYGSGDLFYWGDPQLEDFRNGSGRIWKQ